MSVSIYRSQVERLEREISGLQGKDSKEAGKEAKARQEILRIQRSITSTTSPGNLRSKQRQIERLRRTLGDIAKRRASISKGLAEKNSRLARARKQLDQATQEQQREQQQVQHRRELGLQQELGQLGARTAQLEAELSTVYDTDRILKEVFVLESETDLVQGTCFNLAGVGLVTCQHILVPNLSVFRPDEPAQEYHIEVIASDPAIDVAKIRAPGMDLGAGLPMGSADTLESLDRVILAGFPNYRIGDTGIVTVGSVTGFRMVSAVRRILVDTSIIAGNSGGPVLNSTGQVIGVAVTGADRMEDAEKTENHGVVPIDVLVYL